MSQKKRKFLNTWVQDHSPLQSLWFPLQSWAGFLLSNPTCFVIHYSRDAGEKSIFSKVNMFPHKYTWYNLHVLSDFPLWHGHPSQCINQASLIQQELKKYIDWILIGSFLWMHIHMYPILHKWKQTKYPDLHIKSVFHLTICCEYLSTFISFLFITTNSFNAFIAFHWIDVHYLFNLLVGILIFSAFLQL